MRQNAKWLLLLALAAAAFYWKILFSDQFSIVEDWEGANQGYAWQQFAVSSLQKGILPLWDPYTFSGHSHIGEMQPGVFYPLKLLLYLWPLPDSGTLSWRLWQDYYILAHWLAAVFMFFLALETGLRNRFAAFVAGICFSFGGLMGNAGGSQLWDSAIWLPLILLCLLRALRAAGWQRRILYALFSGLSLGMAVLAGSLHLPVMDVLVIVSLAAFFAFSKTREDPVVRSRSSRAVCAAVVVLVIGIASFASAAVQLLPSIEYAPLVVRWGGGGGTSLEKISYADITARHFQLPHSLFAFLVAATTLGQSEFSPYLGTLPLFLAIAGAGYYWRRAWVKYAAGLAVLAFAYSLAGYSLLFGLLYLAPFLDMVREPARFIYLTHFALALLAGFGVEALWEPAAPSSPFLQKLAGILRWLLAILLVAVGIPTLYGKPIVNEWAFVGLLLLFGAWGIFAYVLRGHRTWKAQLLLAAMIVWDLHVFFWLPHNRLEDSRKGSDYLEQLLGARPLADFFHSQPGLFRVDLQAEIPEFFNLGDMFGVQATWGQGATTQLDYPSLTWHPKGLDLLNVRYLVTAKDRPGTPVFTSGRWKVYENPSYYPRAWVVHQAIPEPSVEETYRQMAAPDFDPHRVALVSEALETPLQEPPQAFEEVTFRHYQADRLEMETTVSAAGLLVLSEMYFPGWTATVNGQPARIYKVNGVLRGVLVWPGQNQVVMRYAPASVRRGALLSILAVAGTFAFAGLVFWRERRTLSS